MEGLQKALLGVQLLFLCTAVALLRCAAQQHCSFFTVLCHSQDGVFVQSQRALYTRAGAGDSKSLGPNINNFACGGVLRSQEIIGHQVTQREGVEGRGHLEESPVNRGIPSANTDRSPLGRRWRHPFQSQAPRRPNGHVLFFLFGVLLCLPVSCCVLLCLPNSVALSMIVNLAEVSRHWQPSSFGQHIDRCVQALPLTEEEEALPFEGPGLQSRGPPPHFRVVGLPLHLDLMISSR